MNQNLRNSGIDIIGDVPWGTHFCQFYQTKEDLMDILVPYFKAGLKNNEFCMWVTSHPLDAEEAKEALRGAVPDLDIYLEKGQIEIIPYTDWYVKEGVFDSDSVLNGWVEKLNQALANGYDGLRLSGNTFWLEKEDWNDFVNYEEEVDRVLGNYQMMSLCTYCLDRCNATEIIDVVVNHQFALIKRDGKWGQIGSSKRKEAEEQYRTLFNTMDEGFCIIEMLFDENEKPIDYIFVETNPAFEKQTGLNNVVGKIISELIPANEEYWYEIYGKVALTGESVRFENLVEALHRWYEVYAYRIGQPESRKVAILFNDITGSKRAEEALCAAYEKVQVQSEELHVSNEELRVQSDELHEANTSLYYSENKFRTLAENSPDLIARFDRQSRCIYANPTIAKFYATPAIVQFYNRSVDELIGKTNSELGIDPELVKFWEGHYENVFATGKPETTEFQYISPQGKKYSFNTQIVPEFVGGKVTYVLVISHDITDMKEVEAKLNETLDNIRRKS